MNKLNDVSLVIATYNEEKSIEFVLKEIENYDFHEIIIIDGNSTDSTKELASKFNTKVYNQTSPGWGSAVIDGFNKATGTYLTYMDGDGSYRPESIIEMRDIIEDYDAVFGSRYKDGNKSPDDTFIRAIGNKIFTFIVRNIFGIKITDSLFFYPLFKKSDFDKISPKSIDFTICIEIPVLLHKLGIEYFDLLSTERKRYAGITKVNALTDGIKILVGILRLRIGI